MNNPPIKTTTNSVDRDKLTAVAHGILTTDLEGYGNVLSQAHRAALFHMLNSFSAFVCGELEGRRAFPLPTGMGKTAAVVAFIAAIERCGYAVPLSVAASQVQALCKLRQSLLDHGVPACKVGLKHSLRDAPAESTGDAEHLYQLVTHARVRGGSDFSLFGEYQGQPRALCLYDETLWRSDTASLRSDDARAAVAWILAFDPPRPLAEHLQEYERRISIATKEATRSPSGVRLELPSVGEGELQEWFDWIEGSEASRKGVADDLIQLLKLSNESLQVLRTDQGTGVIAIRQAVPEGLRNVAILDASAPIRALAKLDRTVHVDTAFGSQVLKSFKNVKVFQYLSGGGRSTLAGKGANAYKEVTKLPLEVTDIINRELLGDPDRCFLIFSYMRRAKDDPPARIRSALKAAGIDLDGKTPDGKRRFEFLTWGQHEGLNGFEHCNTVILAGVLQRDHLSLTAAIKGQQDDPLGSPSGIQVRQLVESEVAHCVYQAASRGSCRRVDDGRAKEMNLHVIHRHQGLKAVLDPVMPEAQWHYPDPRHLPKATATGKTEVMLGLLIDYLGTLNAEVKKVSSKVIKGALALADDVATKQQFTTAMQRISATAHGWSLQGRSLMRST